MTDQRLKRTPSSTGNRSVHTWSGWIKRDRLFAWERLFSVTGQTLVQFTGINPNRLRYLNQAGGVNFDLQTNELLRDSNSWMNVIIAVDHTLDRPEDRVKIYFNGVRVDKFDVNGSSGGAQDLITDWNETIEHGLLGRDGANPGENFRGEAFDVYWVDGVQLPPEVFGYYKKDEGYESVGSQKTSMFTPGQWSPRLPKSVKYDINSRGGFGANGFYIPLNDGTNPGADFHCDPNTIVKLKGEDLPQPRNGAPATTDTYVSQLRYEVGTLGFDGAVKFDGSGDYLSLADNADYSFDGDFTIEAFVYPTAFNSFNTIFSTENLDFKFISTGAVRIYTSGGSNTTGTIPLNQWSHVALVRQSSTFKVYINGNGETVTPPAFTGDGSSAAEIGRKITNSSEELTGYISNLRVVKGTAVYTSNFTAPTEPLTNVTNTKLLCCNSSTSATASTVTPGTITANGNAFATRNELTGSIVLAVPGLNQNTVTNMVTNGNFEKDLVGWSTSGTTTPSIASANFLAEQGTGALLTTGTADGAIWQAVSGSTNQKYLITFDIVSNSGGFFGLYINSNGPNSASGSLVKDNITTIGENYYIRDGNLTAVEFRHRGSSSGIIDNIRVYPLDQSSFRDYSADIKGSGSNKTLTVGGGNPGIIASHSFYGSAMSFRQEDSDNISIAGLPAFGTGDWTVEEWVKLPKEFATQSYWRSSLGVNGDSNIEGAVTIYHTQTAETPSTTGGVSFIAKANQYRLYATIDIRDDNWHHIAVEKYNNVVTLYVDGVAHDSNPDTNNYDATNNTRIGVSNTSQSNYFTGEIQDVRVYQGVAKYKGGFDVSKPYAPVGFAPGSWRTTPVSSRNKFVTMDPNGYQTTGTYGSSVPELSNGNLTVKHGQAGQWERSNATFGASEGKWYFEFKIDVRPEFAGGSFSENWAMGVRESDSKNFYFETDGFEDVGDHVYWMDAVGTGGSAKIVSNQDRSQGSTAGISNVSNGDVINVAFEKTATTLKVWFGINGTYFNSGNPSTGASPAVNVSTTSMYIMPSVAFYRYGGSSQPQGVGTFNFGQNPSFSGAEVTAGTNTDASGKGLFKYSVPTDFNCICTQNLTAPAIADPGEHFKAVLYTGSGGVQSINQVGYKPDLVWLKCRTDGKWHALVDSVRGNTKTLFSNDSTVEVSETHVPSFNSNGFTVADIDSGTTNEPNFQYVGWCWKAGGPTVTNNDGSITSQVSVNQDAGFSIVTYTGNGSSSATVGHGLNKTPAFSIIKSRTSGASVNDWWTYIGADDYARVRLNVNIASTIGDGNNALKHAPDTSVFTLTNFLDNNVEWIVYSWAEVENFSKVGTYLGNGNDDGPMIVCGFKPAWVMVKRLDAGNEGWPIYDNVRGSYNPNAKGLYANDPLLENDAAGRYKDFLSNGFKIRGTSGEQNTNGARYLYVAFAESPFSTANAK